MAGSSWQPSPAQRRAIEHGQGPLRIRAGAGSGKTTTLVRRIEHLVKKGRCQPEEILMLTFTTKAVGQMQAKVAELLGSSGVRVETYHAFALSLITEFGASLGLPEEPLLLAEGELRLFLRRRFDALGITSPDLTRPGEVVKELISFASWHRHEDTFRRSAAELLALVDEPELVAEYLNAFEVYRQLLLDHGAVDYDDLIARAVELLSSDPGVRAEVQGRYRYLLVDEYQDTDHLQSQLVSLLAGEAGNVTIVGDPDQTIYSFRGAAMTNIEAFHEVFADVVDVEMVTNYRSTGPIVAVANAVIKENERRKEAELEAYLPDGSLPVLVEAPDWPAEVDWLVAEVERLAAEGVPYSDMAILVRKHKLKLPFYAALVAKGIPAQVWGGSGLFDEPAALRLLGFIQALANPLNDQALALALTLPRYGFSENDLAQLGVGRQRSEGLLGALTVSDEPRAAQFLADFWPLYRLAFSEGALAAVRGVIELHGAVSPGVAQQVLQLAEGLSARPQLFGETDSANPLAVFSDYLDGLRDVDENPEGSTQVEGDGVQILTVHAAKGLEFPVLFLPRLTANDFGPKKESWKQAFPLAWHHDKQFVENYGQMLVEEERRLFYVAVTRAKERLYLSWSANDPDRKRPQAMSPFLSDEVVALCRTSSVGLSTASVELPEFDLEAALAPLTSTAPPPPAPVAGPVGRYEPALPQVLSYTHLDTYRSCPYRFYLQYLLGLPGKPSQAADEGVKVHAALEQLAIAQVAGQDVSFDQLWGWVGAEPAEEGSAGVLPSGSEAAGQVGEARCGPDSASRLAQADSSATALRSALEQYWESEFATQPPLAAEAEFHLALGGGVIRGFIDRLHQRPDGSIEVVDFKTYNRVLTETQVRGSLQLPIYVEACRRALDYPQVSTGVYYFVKQAQTVRVTYSDDELAARLEQAAGLVQAIQARAYQPTPSQEACRYCPFNELCPAVDRG